MHDGLMFDNETTSTLEQENPIIKSFGIKHPEGTEFYRTTVDASRVPANSSTDNSSRPCDPSWEETGILSILLPQGAISTPRFPLLLAIVL